MNIVQEIEKRAKELIKAIGNNGTPELINIDRSDSNKSAIKIYNKRSFTDIEIRQCKYLNNIVEQDHRNKSYSIIMSSTYSNYN